MDLKNNLKKFQFVVIKRDLIQALWFSFSLLLFVFIFSIIGESIFYFSPRTKLVILGMLVLVLCFGVIGIILSAFLIRKNAFKKYKWSQIALLIGEKAFPKKDSVLNALQLEETLSESSSKGLSYAFIKKIKNSLINLEHKSIITTNRKWKIISLFLLIFIVIGLIGNKNIAGNSIYRWVHPEQIFDAPKPFMLASSTGDVHLLGGDNTIISIASSDTKIDTVFLKMTPLNILANDSLKSKIQIIKSPKDSLGNYVFELKDIFQDFTYEAFVLANHFWQAWEEVRSPKYRIMVTDRPTIQSFSLILIPPRYSGLDPLVQSGNQANVQGLKGTTVSVNFTSNRKLEKSYLKINDLIHPLRVMGKKVDGEFTLTENGIFTIHLLDNRDISNRDPIPYHLEVIPDLFPQVSVYEPPPIMDLGDDQSIPIHLDIEDDFGFSTLQIGYEIRRPAYIESDPIVSVYNVSDIIPDKPKQTIYLDWDLSNLMLMPEDEVHYHFEVYDNDDVSGPKKSLSGNFVARLPSLEDLFLGIEKKEDEIMESIDMKLEDLETIHHKLDDVKLDLIKSKDMDWQQQENIKKILNETKEKIKEFQKMSETMETLKESVEKHQLFSPELMEKFSELNELVNELISEELLSNMENVEDMLDEMNPKEMMDAISDMTENIDQIEQELDRFLEILKRIKAEQKLDEISKRLEQLTEQQDNLDKQLWDMDDKEDSSTFLRHQESEMRIKEELEHIQSAMNDAAKLSEEFSPSTAEAMEQLAESSLMKSTEKHIENSASQLGKQQLPSSKKSSKSALSGLNQLHDMAMNIQEDFQQETSAEMAEKFQEIMSGVIALSKTQENLRKKTSNTPRNSQRVRELAGQQQIIKDQLSQIMSSMMELSKETFAVTPEMGKAMGKAFTEMEESISKLSQRHTTSAKNKQDLAMEGLNEAAMSIHNSIQQMQSGGSASGYEQFLQQMEEMAGQQQGINNQGMQLAMGQMAAGMQQALMQQMLSQQSGLKKSLDQLMEEMAQSGSKGMGDLSGMGEDMDDVIKDLKRNRYTRKTQERQERILSRMLDSQKSMTQRGKKEERLAESASQQVKFIGPSGLPEDLGQRQTLTSEALNQAIQAGYTQEYIVMIRRYFNAINNSTLIGNSNQKENE